MVLLLFFSCYWKKYLVSVTVSVEKSEYKGEGLLERLSYLCEDTEL